MCVFVGLLCGLFGLVFGVVVYELDVFGIVGQVVGQVVYDFGGSGLFCCGGLLLIELSLEEVIEWIFCYDLQICFVWVNVKVQVVQVGIGKFVYLLCLDGCFDVSCGYSDMDYCDVFYFFGDGYCYWCGVSF